MERLVIKGIPPTLNEWRNLHYFKEAKLKKYWEGVVGWEVKVQRIKPRQKKTLVIFHYYFKTKHRRDPDNYVGPVKYLMDGLVKAGILKDDSFDHVDLMIKRAGIDKQDPRVEIEFKEVNSHEDDYN